MQIAQKWSTFQFFLAHRLDSTPGILLQDIQNWGCH